MSVRLSLKTGRPHRHWNLEKLGIVPARLDVYTVCRVVQICQIWVCTLVKNRLSLSVNVCFVQYHNMILPVPKSIQ